MKQYMIPVVIAIVSAMVIAYLLNPNSIRNLRGRIRGNPNVEKE